MDLAIGNVLSHSVGILLNNGDGTFASMVSYLSDRNSEAVAVADLNGDGKLDLAVGNFFGGSLNTGSISILLGVGNGTFQAAVNYAAGSPYRLAIADLNADGKLDLAAASWMTNKATILLGNGNGTFQPAVTYSTGSEPRDLVVEDFNEDGKLDLAVTCFASGETSILLGQGDGTFHPATNLSTASALGMVARDLDGDDNKDLVIATAGSGAILVLLGNGNGTFQLPVSYPTGAGSNNLSLADFNGDALTDVVVINADSGSYSILRGNGDGTFQTAVTTPSGIASMFPIASDFNGDGKPDLVILNNHFHRADVFFNSPSASGLNINATVAVPTTPTVATFIDYNSSKVAGDFTASINWGDGTPSSVGTVSVNGSSEFQVTGSHTYSTVGTYELVVSISDTAGNFETASSTATVKATTSTAVSSSLNPSTLGQSVTFTATVTSASSTPSGSVQFKDNGTNLGTAQTLSGGSATFSTSALTFGPHAITAEYSGSPTFVSSTGTLAGGQVVKATTSTAVSSSLNPSTLGQSVTFTATVTSVSGTPSGSVQFKDNGTNLGTAQTLSGGSATFTTSALTFGNHTITAEYSGSATFVSSAGTLAGGQVVKATTSTAVSSSINPSDFGQEVTFTATVTSTSGTPTGAVQFKDNGTNLGAPVSLSAGSATVTTSTLTSGTHIITAEYAGASTFESSAGTLVNGQVVRTQPSVSINDAAATEGDSGTKTLTFTATLSAASNLVVKVDFGTADVSATGGIDYQSTSGNISFNPGEVEKTISVTLTGDTINEPDEDLVLNISNAVNAQISRAQGTGSILNDDAPVLLVDATSGRALALTSPTQFRDPFSLTDSQNLSTDSRTRISLFVWRLGLLPGDTASNVKVSAEDNEGRYYEFTVEYLQPTTSIDGVSEVIVRLPDIVIGAPRDLFVSVQLRGPGSNKEVIKISAP